MRIYVSSTKRMRRPGHITNNVLYVSHTHFYILRLSSLTLSVSQLFFTYLIGGSSTIAARSTLRDPAPSRENHFFFPIRVDL